MGAFSSKGEAADIAPVQLKGGFNATAGVAGAVADVVGIVAPIVRQETLSGIKEELNESTDSIKLALEMAKNPALAKSQFSEEALRNPVTQQAFQEFNLIQNAATQGKIPASYARERLAVIQDQAIADAPAFESEIRGMLRQATGMDAEVSYFQNLLDESPAKLSPEQKANAKNRQEAQEFGIDLSTYVGFKRNAKIASFRKEEFAAAKAEGTYTGAQMKKEANLDASLALTGLIGEARKNMVAGQPYSEDFKLQMKNSTRSILVAARQKLMSGLPSSVDATVAAQMLAESEQLAGYLEEMIEDNSVLNLAQNDVLLKKSTIEQGVYSSSMATAYHVSGGGAPFNDLIQLTARSEAAQSVLTSLDPALATFKKLEAELTVDGLVTQATKIGDGVVPETQLEKNERTAVATNYLGAAEASEELREKSLNDLAMLDPEFPFAAFGTQRVLQQTPTSNFLKASLINLQAQSVTNLSAEYLHLPKGVDRNSFEIQNDVLLYTGGDQTIRDDNEDVAAANAFASRFNRTNMISAKHFRIGTLAESRYTNTARLWETVNGKAAGEEESTEDKEPARNIRYDFINGELIEVKE